MIHVLTLSVEATLLAHALTRALEAELHAHRGAEIPDAKPFSRIGDRIAEVWATATGVVALAPTGVVVRAIAPLVVSKHRDPAVVCCDVLGRWAVPLLGGHERGGNALAIRVANLIAAEPVVTTTSEALRDHIVGVGCRRGTEASAIVEAIHVALGLAGVPQARVRFLATAALKSEEPGLIEAARVLGLSLRLIDNDEIRACAKAHDHSPAAMRQLDLPAVAEPCALLAGRRTSLCLRKQVIRSVTVAVARERSLAWDSGLDTHSIARVEQKRRSMRRTSS